MISFLKKYRDKFRYAFAGLFDGARHDRSIQNQLLIAILVVVVCCFLPLTTMEWMLIIVMIGLVITMEYLNSAIEQIVDVICPTYDIRAKKIKDYAAAAVLVISICAAIVGIFIIGGNLW